MLFADVDQGAAAGYVGFGLAVVTMIGGLAKAYFDKDQAVKLAKLEDKLKNQDEKIENQGTQIAACEARHKECEDKDRAKEIRIALLEASHGPGRCVPVDVSVVVEHQQPVTIPPVS